MSDDADRDEFERRLDEVARSLREVADQISALRDYVPRPSSDDDGTTGQPTFVTPDSSSVSGADRPDARTSQENTQRELDGDGEAREPSMVESAFDAESRSTVDPGVEDEPDGTDAPEKPSEPVEAVEQDSADDSDVDSASGERRRSARGRPAYNPLAESPRRRPPPEAADRGPGATPEDESAQAEASDTSTEQDASPPAAEPTERPRRDEPPEEPADASSSSDSSSARPPEPGPAEAGAAAEAEGNARADTGFRVENWIDKIGIALVLLGVAFLYKLSVEMGLITPLIKVSLGGVVSTVLLGVGLKIRKKRRGLAQIMMGGASAGYYLSVFAASQIYELISDPVALAATLGVAAGTFGLAVREDTPALTVVGAIGAFATPFFLEATNAGQLLAFNAIIVVGMTAVYAYKGWGSLLLTYATGGWLVVLYAVAQQLDDAFSGGATSGVLLAQIGLTLTWLATSVVPTVRAWLRTRRGSEDEFESGDVETLLVFGLVLLGPVFYQVAAHILWDWPELAWVGFDIGWAAAAAFLSIQLDDVESDLFAAAFRFVALTFGTLALFEYFGEQWLPTALAIEGAALCYMGRRIGDDVLRGIGHILVVGTSLLLLLTLDFVTVERTAFFNADFLKAIVTIAALAAVSVEEDSDWLVLGYRYLAHGLVLLVVLDQSVALEHGQLVCTAIWGAYAIGVLVAGTVVDSRQTTLVGFLTIVLTAAKLIAFDMADTETIWRVAVFIGFGGALLLTSYLVPGLARGRGSDDEAGAPTQPSADDAE